MRRCRRQLVFRIENGPLTGVNENTLRDKSLVGEVGVAWATKGSTVQVRHLPHSLAPLGPANGVVVVCIMLIVCLLHRPSFSLPHGSSSPTVPLQSTFKLFKDQINTTGYSPNYSPRTFPHKKDMQGGTMRMGGGIILH